MKLHDVPDNSKIKILGNVIRTPIGGATLKPNEILHFHHLDGMYSYCTKTDGTVVHLIGYSDVEIYETCL